MIDVLFTPAALASPATLDKAQVVVLDVVRATSTIITALNAGARAVHLFDSLHAARQAKAAAVLPVPLILAGEQHCLKPADFDLGNSPREHTTDKVGGATILLATTNGTRAAFQARLAKKLFAACLLNASATAEALLPELDRLDTLLLCSGTEGKPALDDTIGAGAILFALLQSTYRTDLAFTDSAWLAYHAFTAVRPRLPAALRLGQSGFHLINAGLEDDIDDCARLDAIPLVAPIDGPSLRVTRL